MSKAPAGPHRDRGRRPDSGRGHRRVRRLPFLAVRAAGRYRAEGNAAFQPHSRRPRTSLTATDAATTQLVLRLREQLCESGLDAGADPLGWNLTHHH